MSEQNVAQPFPGNPESPSDSSGEPNQQAQPLTSAEVQRLLDKLDQIGHRLQWLESHLFFKSHKGWGRLFLFQLVRGLALGLGSILGATVVLYGLVYLLSHMDFIPVVGEWANQLINVLKENDAVRSYVETQQALESAAEKLAAPPEVTTSTTSTP